MGFWDWSRNLTNSLPVIGGVSSAMFGDPDQEAVQRAYQQAQEEQRKQRAYQMDGRMNAMNQGALAFGPRNQMLGQMMGQQGPTMDLGPMMQNPMPMQQQQDIRQAAFGKGLPPPPGPMGSGGTFDPRTLGNYGRGGY